MIKKIVASVTVCFVIMAFMPFSALAVSRYEVLQIGDRDQEKESWVEDLQQKLYDAGYLKVKPTGYFGTDTQNAVVQFQTENGGLVVDGKAGPMTRKAVLGDAYADIDSSRQVASSGASAPADGSAAQPSTSVSGDALNPGDKGDSVSSLQQRLKDQMCIRDSPYTVHTPSSKS